MHTINHKIKKENSYPLIIIKIIEKWFNCKLQYIKNQIQCNIEV